MSSDEETNREGSFDSPNSGIHQTVGIVSEVYRQTIQCGDVFFYFENGFMSISDLLYTIIYATQVTRWCIDKEELARTWPVAIIIPPGHTPEEFSNLAGTLNLCEQCTVTPLDERYINLLTQHVQVDTPSFFNPLEPFRNSVRTPTHEVHLTTFWTDWHWNTDAYMKRVFIPRSTVLTSLLICQTAVGSTSCKYSVTWLPHYHCNGTRWNRCRASKNLQFNSCPVTCTTTAAINYGFDVTCILWNSGGASISTLLEMLRYLLMHHQPHLIVVTETNLHTVDLPALAEVTGYSAQTLLPPEYGFQGMWILWQPNIIALDQRQCSNRFLHLMLQVAGNPGESHTRPISERGRSTYNRSLQH